MTVSHEARLLIEAQTQNARLTAEVRLLRAVLQEAYDYVVRVENRLAPWAASRPGRVKFPEDAAQIGQRVRAALAAPTAADAGQGAGDTGGEG